MFTPLNATQIKSNLRKSYLGEKWEFLHPWYIILKQKKKKAERASAKKGKNLNWLELDSRLELDS